MRILLLARSLGRGGAERQIAQLASALRAAGEEVRVAVFYGGGAFERALTDGHVPLDYLNKKGPWDFIGTSWRLMRVLRTYRPDVIYSFMLGPNIFSAAIKPLIGKTKVVWGIRTAAPNWQVYGRGAVIASWTEAMLAKSADLIICNSEAGRRASLARGFPSSKVIVIPNGIDTVLFRPNATARQSTRARWGVKDTETLVGIVGRLDPHKGHPLFLDAMREVLERIPGARAICVGDGLEGYARTLKAYATKRLGATSVIWIDAQDDMLGIYNALDVLALCSTVEGFPNVLAEAMACGTPVVTTTAGDAAVVVDDARWVLHSRDCRELAQIIVQCIQGSRHQIGSQNRERICRAYSMESAVNQFLRLVA